MFQFRQKSYIIFGLFEFFGLFDINIYNFYILMIKLVLISIYINTKIYAGL